MSEVFHRHLPYLRSKYFSDDSFFSSEFLKLKYQLLLNRKKHYVKVFLYNFSYELMTMDTHPMLRSNEKTFNLFVSNLMKYICRPTNQIQRQLSTNNDSSSETVLGHYNWRSYRVPSISSWNKRCRIVRHLAFKGNDNYFRPLLRKNKVHVLELLRRSGEEI